MLTNLAALRPGTYALSVTAEDSYGNSISSDLLVIVVSVEDPTMGIILAGFGIAGIVIVAAVLVHPRGRKALSTLKEGRKSE